jgi:hypothetical protein
LYPRIGSDSGVTPGAHRERIWTRSPPIPAPRAPPQPPPSPARVECPVNPFDQSPICAQSRYRQPR